MKKLLTIALLTLSPVTFAETVTPDLLVGKWQCIDLKVKRPVSKFTIQFFKENILKIDNFVLINNDSDVYTSYPVSYGVGKWQIKNNMLAVSLEELSRQKIESMDSTNVNALKTLIAKSDDFHYLRIYNISKNRFSLKGVTDTDNLQCKMIKR